MARIKEDYFFFTHETGEQLYGCLYQPPVQPKSGILIAPPLGRERLRVYRELACSSRALARQGYAVLRFDYRGEGESEGTFQEATLSSRAQDLVTAAGLLRERTGCEEVVLLGVREGALVVLLALERLPAERIILCEPICNPRGHAKQLIRSNLVLQKQYYGKARLSSDEIVQRLEAGEAVSIYGFQLGRPLVEELERLAPEALLEAFTGRSALIYFAPKEAPPKQALAAWQERLQRRGSCEAICARLNFSWTTKKVWDARLGALDEALAGWLERTEATR